MEPLL